MRNIVRRYWIAALLALPIGYGLGALAFTSLAAGESPGAREIHSWGIPGLAVGAVAIVGAMAAIVVADSALDRSTAFRMLWGGLGAGAAIVMACLMVAALGGFSGGIFVVYFALILAISRRHHGRVAHRALGCCRGSRAPQRRAGGWITVERGGAEPRLAVQHPAHEEIGRWRRAS